MTVAESSRQHLVIPGKASSGEKLFMTFIHLHIVGRKVPATTCEPKQGKNALNQPQMERKFHAELSSWINGIL